MGYYTDFRLTVLNKDGSPKKDFSFENVDLPAWCEYIQLDELMQYPCNMKWYSYAEDMEELSKLFPDYIFLLEGEGEEALDLWRAYYCNGKKQSCPAEVVYPPLDLSRLV